MILLYSKQILMGVINYHVRKNLKIGLSLGLVLCFTLSLTHGQTNLQKKLYDEELALPLSKITLKTWGEDFLWTAHFNDEVNIISGK